MHGAVTQEIWKVNNRQLRKKARIQSATKLVVNISFYLLWPFISLGGGVGRGRGEGDLRYKTGPQGIGRAAGKTLLVQLPKQKKKKKIPNVQRNCGNPLGLIFFFFFLPLTGIPALSHLLVMATGAHRNQNAENGTLFCRPWSSGPKKTGQTLINFFFFFPSRCLPATCLWKQQLKKQRRVMKPQHSGLRIKKGSLRDAWVAKSVEPLTFGFGSGPDLRSGDGAPCQAVHSHRVCLGFSLPLPLPSCF